MTCEIAGCEEPCHSSGGKQYPFCHTHHKERRRIYERNRRRDAETGKKRVEFNDGWLLSMIAFPEPEKYLALIREIAETEHKDGRTIEHRMQAPAAGVLGRARGISQRRKDAE